MILRLWTRAGRPPPLQEGPDSVRLLPTVEVVRPQRLRSPPPDDVARASARVRGLRRSSTSGAPHRDTAEPLRGGWVPDDEVWPADAEPPAPGSPPVTRSDRVPAPRGELRAYLVDRLPPALRSPTVAASRRAVGALAAAACVVVALTSWLLLRSGPHPQSVGVRPVPRTLPAAASASPTKAVVVDVAGKVRRPGVVRLPFGSRVADALRAAGGVQPGTDVGLLNLARPLADGEQVVVGIAAVGGGAGGAGPSGTGAGSAATGPAGGPVDLNVATVADLDGLPGVGPVLAQRIVEWRGEHGPFTSVDQLREVSGIGDRKFDDLKSRVRT